jgi:putative cell wall-binding protein
MNQIIHINANRTIGSKRFYFPHTLLLRAAAIIVTGSLLVACASKPQAPTLEISAAEQSMVDAEQARVAEYALPELQEARTKLSAARTAVQNENMVLAKRMAEQASVDIKLASAKSELAKARDVNDDMKKNIHVLKQEMNRKMGDQQ